MKFLKKVVGYIRENKLELNNLTIVLPSERAKNYISRELYFSYQKPIVAPQIVTMDKWVKSHSPNAIIDNTRALLLLYKAHLTLIEKDEESSFDEFISWGETLLSDFNEIERYEIEAKLIFKNLADIKEIENWSFNSTELTDNQKEFMLFWDRLPKYYEAFTKSLIERNVVFSGTSYAYLSQHIEALFQKNKNEFFLFVGFNALSISEKSIIKQVCQMGKGQVLIDGDEYYVKNNYHEAGRFLRDIMKSLDTKEIGFIESNLMTKKMQVDIVECAQNVGQVKVAGSLLSELSDEELNQTLLLMADESLVGAMMQNLPKNIGKANITLGLPLKQTPIKTWIDLLFSIQENKIRFSTSWIHYSDLKQFLRHPFVLGVMTEKDAVELGKIESDSIRNNRVFINPLAFKQEGCVKDLLFIACESWEFNWELAMESIRGLNRTIYKELGGEQLYEKAVLHSFDRSLVDFSNIVSEGLPNMSLKSFRKMFNAHWVQKGIAYHGNPTEGLQIMGLLETRGLDFKNIICIGMNEGNLPPTNPINTLIPMDLRAYFGLPTPRDKQGIFAHHFYRLLHECEKLTVTYTTAKESIGSNEISRYILQLEKELQRLDSAQVEITRKVAVVEGDNEISKEVIKTPEIIAKMDEVLQKSMSPSMIKVYIDCSLDFYYKKIIGLSDNEKVEEQLAASNMGTFVHETLEDLYRPFSRRDKDGNLVSPAPKNVTSFDVEKMLKEYSLILDEKVTRFFDGNRKMFETGKNYLAYSVAQNLIEKFLKSEIEYISQLSEPLFIEGLELTFEEMIEIEVDSEKKKANIKGVIDRIDSCGNEIRIIDYKTGKVDGNHVSIKSNLLTAQEIRWKNEAGKHVYQLMQYAYLYRNFWNQDQKLKVCIVSFISNKFIPFELEIEGYSMNEIIEYYPIQLAKVAQEMYDESIPFHHDSTRYITYCNYCE